MPHDIGLIGATGIAVRAMLEPARAHRHAHVRAVAASSPARAEAFRAEHGLPVAHTGYAELLADDSLDVVYVSLHNSAHAQWAIAAAEAGKHVIVEKPLCLGLRELHAIRHAARSAGVRVVEAMMTGGHPWPETVREVIASAELGELTEIRSDIRFDLPAGAGYRFRPELGGGALYDTAGYWLQAVQETVGLDKVTVHGSSDFAGPHGVDLAFTATLDWPGGLRARLDAALTGPYRADHEFVFTAGRIRLRNFLRPAAGPFPVNLAIVPADGRRRVVSFPPTEYYRTQFERVLRALDDDTGGPGTGPDTAAEARIALTEQAYLDALSG
ncbi:Gfo/Idh/MocA family protein [Amycolatopsis sacchari]|uniref:Gfo/Idh/MocA family protein n=1 Tax=Amycolatopsis sacchari TaxID=115433 RepID=UPI003D762B4D